MNEVSVFLDTNGNRDGEVDMGVDLDLGLGLNDNNKEEEAADEAPQTSEEGQKTRQRPSTKGSQRH